MATDVDYGILVGTIGDYTSHEPRVCSTGGLTSRTMRVVDEAVYFLVVPLSANREGSYGFDSEGLERPIGRSTCYERWIGTCP